MKAFFSKLLHDTLARVLAALAVAGLALLLPGVRSVLGATLEVPAWVLLVAFLCAGLGLAHVLVGKVVPRHEREYREDEIDGIIWRWRYKDGALSDLRGFCAKAGCDTELMLQVHEGSVESGTRSFRGTTYYCTSCNATKGITNAMDLPDHERRKIEKKIRDGSWKKTAAKI